MPSSVAASAAGKKVVRCKRHLLVDTHGLLLIVDVHPASLQDREGAETLMRQARRRCPLIERIFGDRDDKRPKVIALLTVTTTWNLDIMSRFDLQRFETLPRR